MHDGQVLEKGQLLFTIDKVRLRNALAQAEAAVATARATLRAAEREARRYAPLQVVVSDQDRDTRRAAAEEARAPPPQALSERRLHRTQARGDRARQQESTCGGDGYVKIKNTNEQ